MLYTGSREDVRTPIMTSVLLRLPAAVSSVRPATSNSKDLSKDPRSMCPITALHLLDISAEHAWTGLCRRLLQLGASPKPSATRNPLVTAAERGHREMCEMLVAGV
jgi:hypothetical protein